MKAVAYRQSLPISDPQSLIDVELPDPGAGRARSARRSPCRVGQPGRHQDPQERRAGRGRNQGARLGCFGRGARGRLGRLAVQAGRPRLVRGLADPSRCEQRTACGRRTHCRTHAEARRFRCGRRAAADRRHGLGTAVRPPRDRRRSGERQGSVDPRDRRGRRRRFDPRAACAATHGADRDRHRIAHRDDELDRGARCASCDRPFEAAIRRAQADRHTERRVHRVAEPDRQALPADRRIDCAAGQVRSDRRSRAVRLPPAQAQERLAALGIDVHAFAVRDARHDPPARNPSSVSPR